MKIILAAFAFAIASPALAQSADPHANHKAGTPAPAMPAHDSHEGEKKGCCPEQPKMACCKDMKGKSCCADKTKGSSDASAAHKGH